MRIRFGPFTIDTETRQLLRDRSECHLSPKAFDVLWSLIELRPKVVEKADLHTRIWPDTFVVDGSLNVLIGEVRKALGDDARQPQFIRTVHGVGYAFCGDAVDALERPPAARPIPCWLTSGDKTFRLTDGENIVGRDPECTVWLSSSSVSRRHARIVVDSRSRRITLEDLSSRNGTSLRDTAVHEPTPLSDGDVIMFGSVTVTLHLWNADSASETKRIARKRR